MAWDLVLTDIDGRPYPLAQHRGQVLLIVNVASQCGFTPQYAALQRVHERLSGRGLVVIGIPSNDFGVLSGQEPGDEASIKMFCSTTYGVTFPMMSKQVVKGANMHPLYRFLTDGGIRPVSWNFTKFLVGRNGRLQQRFGSRSAPDGAEMIAAMETALATTAP